jgi:Glyoxalase-like domain
MRHTVKVALTVVGVKVSLTRLRQMRAARLAVAFRLSRQGPGGRSVPLATRTQRVDAEARRLTDLGATLTGAMSEDGLDWYAVGMKDPEGNEFDIN